MFYYRKEGGLIRLNRIGFQWFGGPQIHLRFRTWKLRVGFIGWKFIWWYFRTPRDFIEGTGKVDLVITSENEVEIITYPWLGSKEN